jgi:hypothetical protein
MSPAFTKLSQLRSGLVAFAIDQSPKFCIDRDAIGKNSVDNPVGKLRDPADIAHSVAVAPPDVANSNSLPSIDWRLWFAREPFDDEPELVCDDESAQFLHDLYRDDVR